MVLFGGEINVKHVLHSLAYRTVYFYGKDVWSLEKLSVNAVRRNTIKFLNKWRSRIPNVLSQKVSYDLFSIFSSLAL